MSTADIRYGRRGGGWTTHRPGELLDELNELRESHQAAGTWQSSTDTGDSFHPDSIAHDRAHARLCGGRHDDDECPAVVDPDDLAQVWAGRARMAAARHAAGVELDDIDRQALDRTHPERTAGRLVDVALGAGARGWRVFPLTPGRKTPRRELTGWETKATTDPDRINAWWHRHPTDNVAIATGPSELVVVDLDTTKPGDTPPDGVELVAGGAQVLDELAHRHNGELPATWTVATPSGGRHLYYEAPAGRELRNTAGRIGWHIDTRARGGFVVAAGSLIDGRRYELVDDTPPAPLPGWLLQLLDPPAPTRPATPARPAPRLRAYVAAALAGEVRRVLDAGPGTRNSTLYTAARALARLIDQAVLPRHVVEHALQAAGEHTGLTPTETTNTIRSALNRQEIAR